MKYSKYIPELKRRETWNELVTRNMNMHIKSYPHLEQEIKENYKFVFNKQVLPSMRSMQFAGKPIEISPNRIYNCFSRETEFITENGLKSFNDYNEGDTIKVLTHTGKYKTAVVKNYGKQMLNEITFHRGRSIKKVKSTSNHRWILFDGSETTNLKIKDILYPSQKNDNFDYQNASPMERLYWCYGYVFGDGTVLKKNGIPEYSMVRLCGEDAMKYLYRFKEMGFETSESNSLNGDVMVYTGKYIKDAPSIEKDGIKMVKAFMDGYLSADAYKNPDWYENNSLSKYKNILSSDEDHQTFLEKHLDVCGYFILNKEDLTGQITNYGERPLTFRYSITNHIGSRTNTAWSVGNIVENVVEEDVWCLEVEDDKSFVLGGGMVTGNCAYAPVDDWRVFSEIMFLLLGGTGVGYSVQKHHVDELPEIMKPNKERGRRWLVADSIEGWADAVKVLVKSYFFGGSHIEFDYSDIRPKGARLITSGGKAPGPQPLKECIIKLEGILESKENGEKLRPIEVHDMVCHIADAVLAGGIRRAALISLFSATDDEMIGSKSGPWWETNPQRGRSNNSAVLLRHKITKDYFMDLWKRIEASGAGEPGIYLTNDKDWGTNPCCEIALRPFQFCNLTEVNVSNVVSQEDYEGRVKAATFIGTLQAGYTDFHYLRPIWQRTTEKDALIGISMTGIGSGAVLGLNMKSAAKVVKDENERVANLIGINKAARTTTVKPAGTTSLTLGTSSGIHAWHNDYYIRRVRVGKNEAIYTYLSENHPELVEDEYFRPHDTAVIGIPQKAPEGSILRNESPIQLLERVKRVQQEWIKSGHRSGSNAHNVSATISVREHEWPAVGEWMWSEKDYYNGLSVLPYSNHTYKQSPFEDCTKEEYDRLMDSLKDVDLSKIVELDDDTDLSGELACAGGACVIV
jgi:ribonucleoside-diphosphate reductase alpha chain